MRKSFLLFLDDISHMAAALSVFAVGKAVWTLEGAASVDVDIFGWNACAFQLGFDRELIVDMVFPGFFVEFDERVGIAECFEFYVDVFIHFKFLLAERHADLDAESFRRAVFIGG